MFDTPKPVSLSSTPVERDAFVKLMVEVKGPHYTIGYLKHMYMYASLSDTDETVMNKFRDECIQEKFFALIDKKDVDTP